MKELAAVILIVGLVFVLSIPAFFLHGYTVQCGWAWFIEPVFGIPTPGLAMCMGLKCIIQFLTFTYVPHKDDDKSGPVGPVVVSYCVPVFSLFIMWVIHFFV